MNFLKVSKYTFVIFALLGLLDNISTIILVRHLGIGVEANPLIKFAFTYMNFYCFLPHLALVMVAAWFLSRPSWNDRKRFLLKSTLFYIYIFVIINNWYQVAQLGYGSLVAFIAG